MRYALLLVTEARTGRAVMDRCRLLVQLRQLPLHVADKQVGEVVREALPDHDSERGEVLAVGGEGVGGNEPAALAQRIRYVEDGVVLDLGVQREREHRQLVASRQQLERAEL